MQDEFKKEFFGIRDETLEEIKKNKYNWNKFLNYWANILDDYSVDNVINLYYYNPYGKCYKTFDDWNNDKIDRRIKPKSKGIPIIDNNYKIYVFDIKQTYGRDYKIWKYNHMADIEILSYFQDKYKVLHDSDLSLNNNFYKTFNEIVNYKIKDNYVSLSDEEVEFVSNTITSLFLSKSNFNIYELPSGYEYTSNLENEDILKCMQIANKETAILYNEFTKNARNISNIHAILREDILNQYRSNDFKSNSEIYSSLEDLSTGSGYKQSLLEDMYNNLLSKYSYINKNKREEKEKVVIEASKEDEKKADKYESIQMSLFESREDQLASKICDIFNSFDTKYQNTFEITNIELQAWEHIKSNKRNLTILLKSPLADFRENAFSYFNTDKTDEIKINEGIKNNYFLQQLYKDKDFSIHLSPDLIHVYWHNFDDKKFDLNISSTKVIEQEDIDKEELEKVDEEVNYIVKESSIIPTPNGIETTDVETKYYNKDGKELEPPEVAQEEYPKFNYHISDEKVDSSFGAKSRFEDNVNAIKLLKELEVAQRNATKEEQDILAKYVGWGGLSDAFDETKDNWNKEYNELKNLLNDEEYNQARQSTLTSFYTPNVAIDGIYDALSKFGFKKGNILEPSCGVGNFFGRIPEELEKSKLYGIELDSISGRIAKKLYPNAKIEIKGNEDTNYQDNLFDVAVGNVPFGNYKVLDKRYKENFMIHDYFFQKTLDKVRAGGIVAFITTDGTLDKKDKRVREYLAKRAELVGAIRLPNNTFTGNANTKVTSDIIFLKKREEMKQDVSNEDWIYTSEYDDGITINNYFINNPDMMLGKMELQSTAYGMDNTLSPIDTPLKELMNKAIEKLPSEIFENITYEINEQNSNYEILDADENIKNNAFVIRNIEGKDIIYQRQDSNLIPYQIQDGMIYKRIVGLCKVKDELRNVFDIQLRDGSDEELENAQKRLSDEYDIFVKRYGYINDSANARVFDSDPDYYLLTSIENKISKDEENDKPIYVKGDVFTKRTIRKSKNITSAEDAEQALRYSLNNRGCVDLDYMMTLYPKEKEEIINELDGLIYQDPEKVDSFNNGWVIESEYLSGNVKQKLNYAKSVNIDNKYDKNIEALEQVQPVPLEYDEISVKLGSTWIPEEIYHQFCCELLDISRWNATKLKIKYAKEINSWLFQASGLYGYGVKNTNVWGTDRADALSIIKNSLNLQSITIYDKLDDDRKVVNAVETANAREKQEL